MTANDLLDETILADVPKLTQEDYDRAYKLDAGIKKLQDELDALKLRIKAEAQLGTKVHGNVVVKVTERNDKDVEAMTAAYPAEQYPAFYKSVLDVPAVVKSKTVDVLLKPAIKVVSITFAD